MTPTPENVLANERRGTERTERHKNSRSGRRATDPHVNWRRIAWLFAAYAVYLIVRSQPSTVRRFFQGSRESA